MRPILFSYGGFHVLSYGVLVAAGYAAALAYLRAHRRELGLGAGAFLNLALALMAGALIGGKLGSILLYYRGGWDAPLKALAGSGFSFYQGFWGSFVAGLVYCRQAGIDPLKVADRCAVALPLGHAIGRLGCLLAGCCFGRPSEGLSVVFTSPYSSVPAHLLGVALHPTQVYEFAGNLAIAAGMHRWLAKRRAPGSAFCLYVAAYAALRLATDPLRGVDMGRLAFGLSTAQWAAAASAAAAALFYFKTRRA